MENFNRLGGDTYDTFMGDIMPERTGRYNTGAAGNEIHI